ncbi:DUF2339 domain-containing protein [[Pseudomonas] boreopolis]|uniref:DUF2339 domain-containing protein n=1 Tax=Xanthomonas boreopolis TaxID=86183 RepID=UPI003D55806D
METIIVAVVLAVLAVPVLLLVALVSISGLKRRVSELERQLAELRQAAPRPVSAPVPPAPVPVWDGPAPVSPRPAEAGSEAAAESPEPPAPEPVAPPPLPSRPAMDVPPSGPGLLERAASALKRWFTEGNVPVKVGMLVLLAGVAALLKYAGDQGWLALPLELRYAAIAAAALGGLVFGWRQRERRRGFALALQGGAIGVLLLVVFAAFKLSGLLPAPAAFALSVALVAGLCVLAVLQESRTLALLGILAGFLAPIWLSTGQGSHVALFSYYAVLNAAVFAIAWFRSWRVLNLVGFGFTFGIGTLWGVLAYRPEHFATTEPFLLLFFAFYLLIPVLHARRGDGQARAIDGSLLFGTPLVAFSLQAGLLHGDRLALALCALGLAAIHAALAAWLLRGERTRLLGQGHAVLAVAFATLAVPLALSARATASVFALEGAGLLWLGLRQRRLLPQVAGPLLQLAAAVGFLWGVAAGPDDLHAIANPTFMSALLLAAGGLASAWCLRDHARSSLALVAYLWGLGWWTCAWLADIGRFAPGRVAPDLVLAWLAASAWLAAEAHRRRPAGALAWTSMVALALALPVTGWQTLAHSQPFGDYGVWAWLAFALLGVRTLACLRDTLGAARGAAQFAWLLLWPAALSLAGAWLADRHGLAGGWQWALLGWPWLLLAALALLRWAWLRWPQGRSFDGLRVAFACVVFGVIALGWLLALSAPVPPAPLPWLPLLNPAELAQLAALVLLAYWLRSPHAPAALRGRRAFVLAGAGLVLVTVTVLRSVHHWGGIAWNGALLSSSLAQTSLTVTWSILGVIGWVLGSRRGQRGVWLAGALLMALVLAKLVLVDRQHLGNLLGIGSFIAYGLLCTAVGYLAPAPPRQGNREEVA